MESKLEALNESLSQLGPLWVSMEEYRLTHSYLALLLTTSKFERIARLLIFDCDYLSGRTQAGPFQLHIENAEVQDQPGIRVISTPPGLTIEALRAELHPA